jgi:hypothetical protein
MSTRAWTLLCLVIFAGLSLAASRYWESILLTAIHNGTMRDQAEYLAGTWLVAFIISSVAAVWTLVGMITKRSRAHDDDDENFELDEHPQPRQQPQQQLDTTPDDFAERRPHRAAFHRRPLDRAA